MAAGHVVSIVEVGTDVELDVVRDVGKVCVGLVIG